MYESNCPIVCWTIMSNIKAVTYTNLRLCTIYICIYNIYEYYVLLHTYNIIPLRQFTIQFLKHRNTCKYDFTHI